MAIQERKALIAVGAVLLFVFGLVFGGLMVSKFFSPASPTFDIPIPQFLAETHLLLDKGQLAEAEKNYRLVLEKEPGNPEAITHLGNIASQRGDLETALRYYNDALGRDPSYLHALWDKALVLKAKGDDAGAIQTWEAFISLVPPDSQDVTTIKKWIAEAQARLVGGMPRTAPAGKAP